MAEKGDDALRCLIGGDLDTVSFVRDYVEFRVDYNVLRALAPPQIVVPDGRTYSFPEEGSRDALCTLISTTITSARELEADRHSVIELQNDQGSVLTIPIGAHYGPEGAHLVPADERGRLMTEEMYIW